MSAAVLLFALIAADPNVEELKDMSRPRLAVLALAAQGVPPEYAQGVTETIAAGVQRTSVFEVISPRQIASILAYEKQKDALGGCAEESCYAAVARAVKAPHLIGGSIAKIGEKLVLSLILIDAASGKALQRAQDETTDASRLVEQGHRTAIVLLQPLLSARRGYLSVQSNVPDAAIFVNESRQASAAGQAIALSAGPHVVKVSADGFYASTADIAILPGEVTAHRITLVPAQETITAYESRASLMRLGAYGTGALAIGSTLLAAIMFHEASGSADAVERFAARPDIEQTAALREVAASDKSAFEVQQGVYLGAMGAAVLLGATSLYLFISGDDPDRYAEFRDLERP